MDAADRNLPTEALWKRLLDTPSLSAYLTENEAELELPVFSAFIAALCRSRGEPPERVIKRARLERSFGHQLFSGKRHPSRDTVLLLAFGLEADIELAQSLLRCALCPPLYPRNRRDATIIFCLFHRYDVVRTQAELADRGFQPIGRSGES